MILKNYMEEIVFNLIDGVIEDLGACKCDKCVNDIAAISLNNLPTKYVVTEKGELYSKINMLKMQVEIDVITAIAKATLLVKDNPHH